MRIELTYQQTANQLAYRQFVDREIVPIADHYDRQEQFPAALIRKMAAEGLLGAVLTGEQGGTRPDWISFGLLNEELGRGCSSARSLLTVHSMVTYAIHRWGSKRHKEAWLEKLAGGKCLGAFGLTEPEAGSDAKSIQTSATLAGDFYVLNGCKKWITFGQLADLFLIFAQCEGKLTAFLVERDTPGFWTKPISGMLGTRASMLAEVHLEDCRIPKTNLIGGLGFGLATIGTSALDIGRYSVAWGCVGIARACLEASVEYTKTRQQSGTYLKEHQLIRQMITDMFTDIKAARLLCLQAGYSKDQADPATIMETLVAKYFASRISTKAASDAVQIHGANGCSSDYPVQRYLRDAKIMEIIEGSTQIQQITIAGYAY